MVGRGADEGRDCGLPRLIDKGVVMVRVPTDRAPTHPGEMLLEEFLKPMGLTQRDLADGVRVPYQRVNELVNGRRGITPASALRLAKFFGVSPGFWMNLQTRWDLFHAERTAGDLAHLEIAHPPEITSVRRSEVNLRGAPEHSGDDDLAEVGVRLEADRHQELGTARRDAASFW